MHGSIDSAVHMMWSCPLFRYGPSRPFTALQDLYLEVNACGGSPHDAASVHCPASKGPYLSSWALGCHRQFRPLPFQGPIPFQGPPRAHTFKFDECMGGAPLFIVLHCCTCREAGAALEAGSERGTQHLVMPNMLTWQPVATRGEETHRPRKRSDSHSRKHKHRY